ncbi:carbohydrate ABC transporter permease [Streptomyces triticagri]|uniref:Carbohydrate ABC transporter permease n=1 Tax=Streptomyces triticagri TaxID=2293568 RepID=A0A372M1B2_9ACTN|nr:carbohydrate ABC transporter permease [Streptomyces triticagri]RFU84380.1 carbohydrate ABC transporter permease [Streptomyces triticagri]
MTTLTDPRERSRPPRKPSRRSPRGERPLDAPSLPVRGLKGVVLTVLCAIVVVPFVGIVATSVADPHEVTQAGGFVLWPTSLDLSTYRTLFAGGVVTQALVVSGLVTLGGTFVSLTLSTMLAYALSRSGTVGNRAMLLLVLLTLLFTPGLIPTYLTVKQFGLLDSLWALILPTAVSGFNVIVLRSFFMNIPRELIDSARIDGAGEFGIFWRVVLPLSRAVLAVIGLFYAVGYWNNFFNALLYINDTAKWPLQLVLRTFVVNEAQLGSSQLGASAEALPPQESIQMAILVISIVPILLVYPFLQRHFSKGMLTGAVKG